MGESGSGKSVATQTIVGLTRGARVSGRATLDGVDLLGARPDALRTIRGARIGMIFQDPLSSLHPYYKVGWQIVEMIREHERGHGQGDSARAGHRAAGRRRHPEPAHAASTATRTSSPAACGNA